MCATVLRAVNAVICGGITGAIVGGLVGLAIAIRERRSSDQIAEAAYNYGIEGCIYGALANVIFALLLI